MKVVHTWDRWTDQQWVRLYGLTGTELVSREERPYLSQALIKKATKKILAGPGWEKKRQELGSQLAMQTEKKDQYLAESNQAWRIADSKAQELTLRIQKLPEEARAQAEKDLLRHAHRNRNIATGIWLTLVGLSLGAAVFLYVREQRRKGGERYCSIDG